MASPPSGPRSARRRAPPLLRRHPRLLVGGALALAALGVYPWAVGIIAARLVEARLSARLGCAVSVERGRAGIGHVELEGVRIPGGAGRSDPAAAAVVDLPFGAVWGGAPVVVRGLRLDLRRGGGDDNVSELLALRRHAGGDAGGTGGSRLPPVVIEAASLSIADAVGGVAVHVTGVDGSFEPGNRFSVRLREVSGALSLAGSQSGPSFGAASIAADGKLAGLRPAAYPAVRIGGGFVRPLPTLALTGIAGTVAPDGGKAERLVVDLRGSYGGARESLWTATGWVAPAALDGSLTLRAERFSLDKIADILRDKVVAPEQATVDASLDIRADGGRLRWSGDFGVSGLTFHDDALAATPIENLTFGLTVRGTLDVARRRLELELFEGRLRDLVGRLSGTVELAPGAYTFADGTKLGAIPKVELRFQVPRLACDRLLASIPPPIVPKLQGFLLAGNFEADITAKVDYADLDAVELRGKVGIDGCRVLGAPASVVALIHAEEAIARTVDIPVAPGEPGDVEPLTFVVGPESSEFVPYEGISPYLVNSIMTTEDSGFFKHRGWVPSEFKAALRRNLARGAFRLGASSITMQMVKNLLLSREKTLSRKLQELFLVWYLEQEMPKERILELYFNAIEFGPRIYGIGPAARHYFGKQPSELTPLEAAFFSSILPSPKRRYIQYCHGSLYPPWEKYVRRILARVHERGRLTDPEYDAASAETLVFDRTGAIPEKQCLDWVRRMTQRTEPEAPPEPDAQ